MRCTEMETDILYYTAAVFHIFDTDVTWEFTDSLVFGMLVLFIMDCYL